MININIPTFLAEGLRKHNIPVPYKTTNSNGFERWGKRNEYWAKEVGDGYVFGDWKTGSKHHAFPNERTKLTQQEKETLQRIQQENKQWRLNEAREKAKEGKKIFESLPKADLQHPYLVDKKIKQIPDDIRQLKNSLVVPIYNFYKEIISVQFIEPIEKEEEEDSGEYQENHKKDKKRYLAGARKQGGFYVIGKGIEGYDHLNICEGWATGMSLYEILEEPVIVAFDAGNLGDVARVFRKKYKNLRFVFYADNDIKNNFNTGLEKAQEASEEVGNAIRLYPIWMDEEKNPIVKSVDWNDIYCEYGDKVDVISKKIEMALKMDMECVKFYTQSAKKAIEDRFYNKENKNDR